MKCHHSGARIRLDVWNTGMEIRNLVAGTVYSPYRRPYRKAWPRPACTQITLFTVIHHIPCLRLSKWVANEVEEQALLCSLWALAGLVR